MSGPVETELPPSAFRQRAKLRLTLTMNNRAPPTVVTPTEPTDISIKNQVRRMDCHELARRISSSNNKHRLPFILLDCRGYLCFTDGHIRGAVHIACTDRFNRKRVQNSGSVLDLVSTNNRRNKTHSNSGIYNNGITGKYRDVIVYDEGTSDLNLEAAGSNPVSFVILHLLQESRQPIYLNGGMKEFTRLYSDLCETSNLKDLSFTSPPTLSFLPSPLCPPLSPYSMTANVPTTPHCNESYENEPPTQVLPFLYVGNARDAVDMELLKKLRIRYILSVTMSMPHTHGNGVISVNGSNFNGTSSKGGSHNNSPTEVNSSPLNENSSSSPFELRTKLIPVSDNLCENLAPYFDEACDFIEEARKSGWSILIHCQAGISRSPTIAIAYIMKHIKLSTLEAYAFVQRSRRIISPNLNFMGQLVEYESKLKSSEAWSPENNTCTSISNGHVHGQANVLSHCNSHFSSSSSPSSSEPTSASSVSSEGGESSNPVDLQLQRQNSMSFSLSPGVSLSNGSSNGSISPSTLGTTSTPMILTD